MGAKIDLRPSGLGFDDAVQEWSSRPAHELVMLHPFGLTPGAGDSLPAPHEDQFGNVIPRAPGGDALYVFDNASDVVLDGTTPIRDGRYVGQRLRLHATAGSVQIPGGICGGPVTVELGQDVTLTWDGTQWCAPDGARAGTLAQLQALGEDEVSVGQTARRTDAAGGRRYLQCLTTAEANSTWGYKEEFYLDIGQPSTSNSADERFSVTNHVTLASSQGQLAYQHFFPRHWDAETLDLVANSGRILYEGDKGAITISVYKNGNGVAIDTDSVDPGADTEGSFSLEGSLDAGEWFEFSIDPTNARVGQERTYCYVKAIRTRTVTT